MYFNNDYMQNLNYYNQNPYGNFNTLNNYSYDNLMGQRGIINPSINNNYQTNDLFQNNNLRSLYPDIYKVSYPVIENILKNTNLNMIDNNSITAIVDNVLNILEGNNNSNSSNNNSRNNIDSSLNTNNTNNTNNLDNNTSSNINLNNSNTSNTFLKDIIRIIILDIIKNYFNKVKLINFINNSI